MLKKSKNRSCGIFHRAFISMSSNFLLICALVIVSTRLVQCYSVGVVVELTGGPDNGNQWVSGDLSPTAAFMPLPRRGRRERVINHGRCERLACFQTLVSSWPSYLFVIPTPTICLTVREAPLSRGRGRRSELELVFRLTHEWA